MKNSVKKGEKCVLYDRECIGCGECEFCDLDPLKICDNCGKCLSLDDYATIKIDSVDGRELAKHAHEGHECGCGCHDDCSCGDEHVLH